jgi:hypothetical protein
VAASYTYDERARLIRATAGPELTFAEYLALRRSVEADPRIPTGAAVLFDLRNVSHLSITGAQVISIAQGKESVERRARRIAVVVKDPVGFGLTRVYDLARGYGPPLQVFREIETALEWVLEGSAPP